MRILTACLLVVAACGDPASDGGGAPATGEKIFRFSAIPDEKPTEQEARFAPVVKYLSDALGVPVEYRAVDKYSASVQAFKNGDIHAAWFGGLSGVQARQAVAGSRAIAQGDKDPNYYSYFIANKNSGLKPGKEFPMEAKGKKLTFGSEGSTSGRLMPEFFIRKFTGKAPNEFFSEVGFSGNHPATVAAVNSGAFDIGAVNYGVYDRAKPEEKANTFILWKTPVYADYNFTILGDLDKTFGDGFTAKLTAAWLAMSGDICQQSFSRGSMIPAKNADFDKILDTARQLDLAR
ncbi:MAG: putative selenate ABC transporter substrate-binding protein [Planctomycetota bacterium]|jgi:phosphonate transport system substrate-binding protein